MCAFIPKNQKRLIEEDDVDVVYVVDDVDDNYLFPVLTAFYNYKHSPLTYDLHSPYRDVVRVIAFE